MPRVLVADDEEDIRKLLRMVLAEFGYEVEEAADGDEALARLAVGPFDLVILDLMMPGRDGFDVLEEATAMDPQPRIAVLTARTGELDRQRVYDLGAIDLTTKPFDAYELVTRLSGLLQLEDDDLRRRVDRDARTSRLVEELEKLMRDKG